MLNSEKEFFINSITELKEIVLKNYDNYIMPKKEDINNYHLIYTNLKNKNIYDDFLNNNAQILPSLEQVLKIFRNLKIAKDKYIDNYNKGLKEHLVMIERKIKQDKINNDFKNLYNSNISWKDNFCNILLQKDTIKYMPKLDNLKNNNLPCSLFKYKNVNQYAVTSLLNDEIWLTNPLDFNDPYDSVFTVDIYKSSEELTKNNIDNLMKRLEKQKYFTDNQLYEIRNSDNPFEKHKSIAISHLPMNAQKAYLPILKKTEKHFEDEALANINSKTRNQLKIFSLSENKDSIKMWSHYADNHKGFCIEYETKQIGYKNIISLYPVVYTKNIIIMNDIKNNPYFSIFQSICKFNDWKEEFEWRLVFTQSLNTENKYKFLKPKAIYLGAKISDNDKALISSICILKDIKFYQMKLDYKEYILKPELVSFSEKKHTDSTLKSYIYGIINRQKDIDRLEINKLYFISEANKNKVEKINVEIKEYQDIIKIKTDDILKVLGLWSDVDEARC